MSFRVPSQEVTPTARTSPGNDDPDAATRDSGSFRFSADCQDHEHHQSKTSHRRNHTLKPHVDKN